MTALEQARTQFAHGEFGEARETALEALRRGPDDVDLVRVAGLAGVELGADDAVDLLRRVTADRPDSGEAWHDLGDALLADGRNEEAAQAFRRAVELDPNDEMALTQLGHTEFAAGNREAVIHLEQAAERAGGMSTAAISLVEMYRALDQPEEALAAAKKVADADPDDVAALLDVAELSLQTGRLDDALAGFERVRELEDLPDHEVYALHGMIMVELRRETPERAIELAREAGRVDEHGRTAGMLAYLEQTPVEAEAAQPAPTRDEVESALAQSLSEHRRLHAEDRRLQAEDGLG